MLRLMCLCGLCLTALAGLWVGPARAFQTEATASVPPAAATPAVSTPLEGTAVPAAATPGGEPITAAILSPQPGQALQGTVAIVVETAVEGFEAVELVFAYANNPTGVWFPIFQGNQPVSGETLAQWDTSQISDGTYTLRMTVKLSDGTQQSVEAAGLRVRNYTPIESDTPTPATPSSTPPPQDTPVPSATPTLTGTPRPPTPTPLPANPAELGRTQVLGSVAQGGLVALGIFALAGLYGALRALRRPRQ